MFVRSASLAAFACLGFLFAGSAAARQDGAQTAPVARPPVADPVVVEMFLSQACQASPPAVDSLRKLAARRDVVALSWHVDYWNDTPSKDGGVWGDPYSRPEFTARQKFYNKRIRGRGTVLTPQAVIDGFLSVAGSDLSRIDEGIHKAQFADELSRAIPPVINITGAGVHGLSVAISGVSAPYDAYLVTFRPTASTRVKGGDNAGFEFNEINVVTDSVKIASEHIGPGAFAAPAPAQGLGCAVLVQERALGRIVAARYCGR